MVNALYSRVVVSRMKSSDGECPTMIHVTKEANGIALLVEGPEVPNGQALIAWHPYDSNAMIERAVRLEYPVCIVCGGNLKDAMERIEGGVAGAPCESCAAADGDAKWTPT